MKYNVVNFVIKKTVPIQQTVIHLRRTLFFFFFHTRVYYNIIIVFSFNIYIYYHDDIVSLMVRLFYFLNPINWNEGRRSWIKNNLKWSSPEIVHDELLRRCLSP